MQEIQGMWVQFLGCEDSLEEEMATHYSILAWNIPWTEEPGGLQSIASQRVDWHNIWDSWLREKDKVNLIKAMVFPVVMYRCVNWTIKKAECWRIDAFQLWCWRRLLRVPWTARRSNQSILKEVNPEYSLEGLMLKLLYFGHLMWRVNSLEKTLRLGKIEGKGRRGQQQEMVGWHHRVNGHEFEQIQETVNDRDSWHAAVHEVSKSRTWLRD